MRLFYRFLSLLLAVVFPISSTCAGVQFSLDIVRRCEPAGPLSYDDFLSLFDRLENGAVEERCSRQEVDQIASFIAFMADLGSFENDDHFQEDILELLDGHERSSIDLVSFASLKENQHLLLPKVAFTESHLIPCKSKFIKRVGHFVKKHKKELIIAAVVIVAATTVVITASALGASAVAAGLAPCASDEPDQKITAFKEVIVEEKLLDESEVPIEEKGRAIGAMFTHAEASSIREHLVIDQQFGTSYPYLYNKAEAEGNFPALCHQVLGLQAFQHQKHEEAIAELDKAIDLEPESTLYLDRGLAHAALRDFDLALDDYEEYLIRLATYQQNLQFMESVGGGVYEGLGQSAKDVIHFTKETVAHPIQTALDIKDACIFISELAYEGEWRELKEVLAPEVLHLIRDWPDLSPEERIKQTTYVITKNGGDIFLPTKALKLAHTGYKSTKRLASVSETFQTAKKVAAFESLEQATEKSIRVPKHVFEDPLMSESFHFFEKAESFLAPYTRKPMPEFEVRSLIHSVGIETFPRPKGVPDDFLVMITRKSGGMEYVHPTNSHVKVRVMPGKPHSEYVTQQKAYVIETRDGKALDKFGNKVPSRAPEAHIPIDEYIYRGE